MTPNDFYTENIKTFETQISALKKRIFAFSMFRLFVFLAMAAAVYFFSGNSQLILIALSVGFILFLLLVNRYSNLKNKLKYLNKIRQLNQLEIKVSNGDLSELENGNQYIFEGHHFNQDIDLFGEGSLFQIINRTATKNGQKQLAAWLNSNNIDQIKEKQKATQEIAEKANWRQNYTTIAALIESDVESDHILQWVRSYKTFTPRIFKWMPVLFSILSVIGILCYWLGFINGYILLTWFLFGLGITGRYLKKTTDLYNITSKINDFFAQYAQLLLSIEKEEFECELLQNWGNSIKTSGINASERLNELAKEIDLLSNRNNMIFAPLANGFLLWDLRYTYRIEKWIKKFDNAMIDWFSIVEMFDAMNSFGNFGFNQKNYVYPTVQSDHKIQLEAKDIGHPLLDATKMVKNSIKVHNDDFFIVTGANMAGKSTFLRTIAINLVLANCGLPVCAESFAYRPIKLISSMRTSDSLLNDESYFFSELKRLKFIIEAIKKESYFIILDEILKGTNSKDKAEGSQKFIEKLVNSSATGLLATHDLSICAMEKKLPQIRNYYFEASIIKNELRFDYKIKKGVCQNMNASFLLHKMKII
jgi:hypothetical protein